MDRNAPFEGWGNLKALTESDQSPIPRVLVPVNLCASNLDLLDSARRFAKQFNAAVELLHVVQLNIAGEERGFPRAGLIRGLADAARRELQKLVETFWDGNLVTMIVIREGCPWEVIVQEARDTGASLIIMGARNRPWLSRLLRPSTLIRVIRHAECPVLAVQASLRETRRSHAFSNQRQTDFALFHQPPHWAEGRCG